LKKSRLLRRYAPRNDTKGVFQVIGSDLNNRMAISKRCSWTFSTDPKAGVHLSFLDDVESHQDAQVFDILHVVAVEDIAVQ